VEEEEEEEEEEDEEEEKEVEEEVVDEEEEEEVVKEFVIYTLAKEIAHFRTNTFLKFCLIRNKISTLNRGVLRGGNN